MPSFTTAVLLATAIVQPALAGVIQARTPPGIPTTATAKTQLAAITVAVQGPQTGYARNRRDPYSLPLLTMFCLAYHDVNIHFPF